MGTSSFGITNLPVSPTVINVTNGLQSFAQGALPPIGVPRDRHIPEGVNMSAAARHGPPRLVDPQSRAASPPPTCLPTRRPTHFGPAQPISRTALPPSATV